MDPENVVVGSCYMLMSLVLFFTNALVFFILIRYKEYHTSTYRIILHMILGCLMQLCSHFVGGFMLINGEWPYVERIAGAWIQFGWFMYLCASLALAIDRTLTFVRILSEHSSVLISWFLLAFAWFLGLSFLVILLIPGFGFQFYTSGKRGGWNYDNHAASQWLISVEQYVDFTVVSAVLVLYFVVFVRIAWTRKSTQATISSFVIELRLLSISVISFLYECTYLVWFFWGTRLLSDGMLSSSIVSFLWIFNCGLFSIATILINGSIRNKIRKLLVRKHQVKVVGVTSKANRIADRVRQDLWHCQEALGSINFTEFWPE